MTTPAELAGVTAALRAAAVDQVQAFLQEVTGVKAVVIATEDGFELASAATDSGDPARLAALASSIAAIGQVVSEEARLGAARCVTIETERGHVLVQTARRRDLDVVIAVLAGADALLGMVKLRAAAAAQSLVRA